MIVRDRVGIKLATPDSAVGLATDCAMGPGSKSVCAYVHVPVGECVHVLFWFGCILLSLPLGVIGWSVVLF